MRFGEHEPTEFEIELRSNASDSRFHHDCRHARRNVVQR